MAQRFNIRVYGIWLLNGCVLVNEEWIRGKKITKFPGGGLEFGEGTLDCLKREWQEELGMDITVGQHFYTTDYYQPSAYDDSQIMSIYYRVEGDPELALTNKNENERTFWVPIVEINADLFTLPIDKRVGGMLGTV